MRLIRTNIVFDLKKLLINKLKLEYNVGFVLFYSAL